MDLPFIREVLAETGVELEAWLRAWARVTPVLVLVPAFGGAALPPPVRAGLGLSLALAIAPALRPAEASGAPLVLELAREVALGLPVALSAAILVYTALMAGGVMDELRGGRETVALPVFEGAVTPLGGLLGLLVVIAFHQTGASAELVARLATPTLAGSPLAGIAVQLTNSVTLAVAAAAPIAVASIVLGVAEALVARAAFPAHITSLLLPLRGVALLAVAALVLDRIVELLILLR